MTEKRKRATFTPGDIRHCLSRYGLGEVSSIEDFEHGSLRTAKAIVTLPAGRFLLKQRPESIKQLNKVIFTHGIQNSLAGSNFPLPRLMRTCDDDNTMVILDDRICELFEFVSAKAYPGSLEATFNGGRILGLHHKLLTTFKMQYEPPAGSYHDRNAIRKAIATTAQTIQPEGESASTRLTEMIAVIDDAYNSCASTCNEMGLKRWPAQIVHGDWHPGNMLWRGDHVVAVIDYDSAKSWPRVVELANGALQFSMLDRGKNLSEWPEYVDETRFKRFILGYDRACVISRLEILSLPFLMCQAIIAEAVLPIAATGNLRHTGLPFLEVIVKKVKWLMNNADHLHQILRD